MDGISNKMEMRFVFDSSGDADRESAEADNHVQQLMQMEGELTILVDRVEYVSENGFLLLEFAAALSNWLKGKEQGSLADFSYAAADCDDTPVIEFKRASKDIWEVCSLCGIDQKSHIFYVEEIVRSSKDFLSKFQKRLRAEYSIELADFTN